MTTEQDRWDAAVEAAWAAFRQRLADAIAMIGDGEVVGAELGESDDHELEGALPYAHCIGWGEGLVRAEAASNTYLDRAHALELEGANRLVEIGWQGPTYFEDQEPDDGSANFWLDAELRQADRVAWMAVSALREVYGCMHPAFLTLTGMEAEADSATGDDAVREDPADRGKLELLTFPRSHEDLQAQVNDALRVILEQDEIVLDGDGDAPIRVGESVVYVRVVPGRPAVEVFAEVVIEPEDKERLEVELTILNRTHPLAKFLVVNDRVVMTSRLIATPFVPKHLEIVVERMVEEVDELAAALVTRVGGRRFLETVPESASTAEEWPTLVALLELMGAGRLTSSSVMDLFDSDRTELVRTISAVRSDQVYCGDHDRAAVLDHLRRGLRASLREVARERHHAT